MAKGPKAGIDVTVDERPAVQGLKRLSKEFASTAVTINQSMEIAGKVFGAVQAGVSAVVSTMADAVRAAMEVERVERRAFAAMQSRAGMTREEFDALGALNDERERRLNIDADEQLQLQGTLAALGVHKDALNAATEATIGLSAVTGQGLAEAGKKVTQVLNGNVNALKELGIQASSVADAQDQLRAMFVLAEAQADTLETRVAALGHAYGTLEEQLGSAVTQSGAAKEIMEVLTEAVSEFTRYLASEEGRLAIDGFFRAFALGAAMAVDSIEDLRVAARDTINWFKINFTDEVVAESLSAEPSTLRKLSARLFAIYQGAINITPPVDATPLIAPSRRSTSGTTGRNARGRAAEQLGPGVSIGFEIDFGQDEIQQQLRQEAEARFHQEMESMKADLRRQAFESKIGTMREQFEQEMALRQQLHDRGMEWDAGANAEQLQAQLDQSNAMRQMFQQGAEMVASGLSTMIANMVSGSMNAEEAFKGFIGGLITNLGTMLLNVGTAAVVLGSLSLIPGLKFITGGTGIGIGAGAAAMVVGAGMIAAGAAIGGGGSSARTPAMPRGGAGGGAARAPSSSMGDMVPRGFQGLAMAGAAPYTVNISFSGVVGDERRAARMIEDVLRRGR